MNYYAIDQETADQLMAYLRSKPMAEVESMVNRLRQMPKAEMVPPPAPEPLQS